MKQKSVEPHWQSLVTTFFDFYKTNFFGEKPTMDGASSFAMKQIVQSLRKRAEDSNKSWDENSANEKWKLFLQYAYADSWLKQNFLLKNINSQKDKIFVRIKQQYVATNKKQNTSILQAPPSDFNYETIEKW